MKFDKILLDSMERVYSVSYTTINCNKIPLFASEREGGECFAYFNNEKTVVWDNLGGTMSLVEIPNKNGDFLATTGFYPGFNAKTSKVVYVSYNDSKFTYKDVIKIPYLHRFDCIYLDDTYYFIGSTLCSNKTEREDWSSPGSLYVGTFNSDLSEVLNLEVLIPNLTKNHGYYRYPYKGVMSAYISSEDGIFVITPPNKSNPNWSYEKLSDIPTSDIAILDIDNDSIFEMITISPFHGSKLSIFKMYDTGLVKVYERTKETDFIHALCGGFIGGKKVFVVGARKMEKELFLLTYNQTNNQYEETFIDDCVGSSNVSIINLEHEDLLLSANNGAHQAVIYSFKK
jgi:hypothetical protein